jgi:uncharacterized protein YoxC
MSSSDWTAVVAAVAIAGLVGGLLVTLAEVRRTLRSLRETLEEVSTDALVAIEELRVSTREARFEIDRVDALVSTAESVTGTVDSASKLAYRTLSNPVVKAVALGAGTKRAIQRLSNDEPTPARKRARRTLRAKR